MKRYVSAALQIRLLFGQFEGFFGWFFFAFGYMFCAIFLSAADWDSFKYDSNPPTTKGTITAIEPTNSSINRRQVLAYYYVCEFGKGVSYNTETDLDIGNEVKIEYVAAQKNIHRIVGMRNAIFDFWVSFVLIFPIIGLAFIIFNIKRGLKAIHILKNGLLAYGKLIKSEPTNTKINDRVVYKYFFEFEYNRQKYIATAKTHRYEDLEDEAQEQIIFLAENPQKSILLDEFSKMPKVDNNGNLAYEHSFKDYLPLLLPSVALIEILVSIFLLD